MKKKTQRTPQSYWTKAEIKKVIQLWNKYEPHELAEELGKTVNQVRYMAGQLRKENIKLATKRRVGYLRTLIREAIEEL